MSFNSPCANRRAVALALLALTALPTMAQNPATPSTPPELAGLSLRGQGRLTFLRLKVYEIRLWSAQALQADWTQQPFALELIYAMSLKGPKIAERSLVEMRRQGEIAEPKAQAWLNAMLVAFPDVKDGDRLVGHFDPEEGAKFWFNGQARAGKLDAEAARWFMGIWLSPQTSEPALRKQLLAL